ncbi:MAG: type II and III secretion system protein [Fuerstiella sp.]
MRIRTSILTCLNAGVIRRPLTLGMCILVLLASGCRVPTPAPLPHKSIQELYSDAVVASQTAMQVSDACPTGMLESDAFCVPSEYIEMGSGADYEDLDIQMPGPVHQAPPHVSDPVPVFPAPQVGIDEFASGPVRAAAYVEPIRRGQSPVLQASQATRQVSETSSGTLITEFLEDTDIRQALQAIASQAQISLIVDEQVTGYVTATIEDAPFESALKTLLLPLGLIYSKVSEKEYLVGLADPETALFAQMSERINFQPMHIPPSELVALLSGKERQFARAVDERNYVLIQAPAEIAKSIAQQLQTFDNPIPQVELEAIVCVISPDQGFRSGLDWGHAVTLNGSEILNVGLQGLAFNGVGSVAGASNAFADFAVTSAFVQLLAQEGYLAIRAAPRVTARDGDQAQIKITRESFFSTQPQSDSNFFRQDIQQVEAGIELDITPVVRGNNITMKIEKAEVSEDIRTSSINTDITENPFPSINRRTVSTTVHVKDGETIVIGGLVQRQTVDRVAQIPVLGSLPGVGRIFQTIEQTQQDAEVVIFISPKLVKPCL